MEFSFHDSQKQFATATVAAPQVSGRFVGVESMDKDEVHVALGCRMPSTSPIKEFMLMSGLEFVATKAQKDALIAAGLSPERVAIRPVPAIGNVTLGSIHEASSRTAKPTANAIRVTQDWWAGQSRRSATAGWGVVNDVVENFATPQHSLTGRSPSELLSTTDAIFAVLEGRELDRWTRRSRNGRRTRGDCDLLHIQPRHNTICRGRTLRRHLRPVIA